MNNAKMWLVVKPTVGIPLFLSAVAVGSFAVHVAVAYVVPQGAGAQEILVMLPDGSVAKAVMAAPETLASADGLTRPPITQ